MRLLAKREVGVNPTRSRHCYGEPPIVNHCFIMKREGIGSDEPKSGDLPVVCTYYLRENREE
jgi:hypothetical protein